MIRSSPKNESKLLLVMQRMTFTLSGTDATLNQFTLIQSNVGPSALYIRQCNMCSYSYYTFLLMWNYSIHVFLSFPLPLLNDLLIWIFASLNSFCQQQNVYWRSKCDIHTNSLTQPIFSWFSLRQNLWSLPKWNLFKLSLWDTSNYWKSSETELF